MATLAIVTVCTQLASAQPLRISTLGRTISSGPLEWVDGVPPESYSFVRPRGIARGPDGSIYFAGDIERNIYRLAPDGTVTGVLWEFIVIDRPRGLAVSDDGTIVFADDNRIARITPQGAYEIVAGARNVGGSWVDGAASIARFSAPHGVALGLGAKIYVADTGNHTIRVIAGDGTVSTLAGAPGESGSADGTGTAARFSEPRGLTVDSAGNVYVSDTGNSTIRKITPEGVVLTLAGSPGAHAAADGVGAAARFNHPQGIAFDTNGDLIVADSDNYSVRRLTPAGVVSTIAGNSPVNSRPVGIHGTLQSPTGVVVDGNRRIYLTDNNGFRLYRGERALDGPTGVPEIAAIVDTYSGSISTTIRDEAGSFSYQWQASADEGATWSDLAAAPPFSGVTSAALTLTAPDRAQSGKRFRVVINDGLSARTSEECALFLTPALDVSVFAGSLRSGAADGIGLAARFYLPGGLARTADGSIFVCDTANNRIRRISPSGEVTTFAGQVQGSADGVGIAAGLHSPTDVVADATGHLYVADRYNSTIRKITPDGTVSTLAGLAKSTGSVDGTGSDARFGFPGGIAIAANGDLYVSDTSNATVRKVTQDGVVTTIAGSPGQVGNTDGVGAAARFYSPKAIAVDASGNVYVGDNSRVIRKIAPDGAVITLAGDKEWLGFVDGTGGVARFSTINDIALAADGSLLVTDGMNHAIRRVTVDGVVTTVIGGPSRGGTRDGASEVARLATPEGIVVGGTGDVYFSDTTNHVVRRLSPGGEIATLAGVGPLQVDGAGVAARFWGANAMATDAEGNVYVADTNSHVIRRITPEGVVSTFAGQPEVPGYADGAGGVAAFNTPTDVAMGPYGSVVVADSGNHVIRLVTQSGVVTTIAGVPGVSGSANGDLSVATFTGPQCVAVDALGDIFVTDYSAFTGVRKISLSQRVVSNYAGGSYGSDDGPGATARFTRIGDIAVRPNGVLVVSDMWLGKIREIGADNQQTVRTLAGGAANGLDGVGARAAFLVPGAITLDPFGNVFVADTGNALIRCVSPDGVVTTVAGLLRRGGSVDGMGSAARLGAVSGLAAAPDGRLYIGETFGLIHSADREVLLLSVPQSMTGNQSDDVTFSVSASGAGARTYRWQFRTSAAAPFADVAVTSEPTLTLTRLRSANEGTYRVIVSSGGVSVVSGTFDLEVTHAPRVTSHSADQSFPLGTAVTLSAVVASELPVAVQWYAGELDDFTRPVVGATQTSFTTPVLYADASYWMQATTAEGTGETSTIRLSVVVGEGTGIVVRNVLGNRAYGTLVDGDMIHPVLAAAPVRTEVAAVSAALDRSMFLHRDGTLWNAGAQLWSDLERENLFDHPEGWQVATGATKAVATAEGAYYLKADHSLWRVTFGTSVQIAADVVDVAAGTAAHVLFLKSDQTLWGFGINGSGQLGDGTTVYRPTPVLLASGVTGMAVGGEHSLFVKSDNTAWAMGANNEGQLGDGTTEQRIVPVPVASGVVAVAAGSAHSLFLKTDGSLWAAGYNGFGQLGDGTTTRRLAPVAVSQQVTAVFAGTSSTCFIKADGTLWGVGENGSGQLGGGPSHSRVLPTQIASGVVSVAGGNRHTLYVKEDGSAWSLGSNQFGQLGTTELGMSVDPGYDVDSVTDVASGDRHTLVLHRDGTLEFHGDPEALGLGSPLDPYARVQVVATDVASMDTSFGHMAYVTTDGALWTLGGNGWGQLGDGTSNPRTDPWNLATRVSAVSTGSAHTVFVTFDGELRGVGGSYSGQLGLGQTSITLTPIAIASDVSQVSAGYNHTLFIKTDGTAWGVGENGMGQLGDGTKINRTAPIQIGQEIRKVWGGGLLSLILKNDGRLFGTGYNGSGELGDGTQTERLSPILIAADVTDMCGGWSHVLFRKTDGSLWGTGANDYGQLGRGALFPSGSKVPHRIANGVVAMTGGTDRTFYWQEEQEPAIDLQPASFSINTGATAAMSVVARSITPATYQWYQGERGDRTRPIAGATTAYLSTPVLVNDASYWVRITNLAGSTESAVGRVSVRGPRVVAAPQSRALQAGASVTLSIDANLSDGSPPALQWFLDGVAIEGATAAALTIPSIQAFHQGAYTVVVSGMGTSITTAPATITASAPPASAARLMNLSTRALCLTGDDVLIPGFYIEGAGTKRVLLRAVGPELSKFGVGEPLADPQIVLKRKSDNAVVGTNEDWGDNTNWQDIRAAATSVYAFSLTAGSKSAALLLDLPAGGYTILASGHGAETGVSIVELYDVSGATDGAQLINISNRGFVGVGGNIMIPGFVVSDEGSRTFLIRAVGPTLSRFNVPGVLANPKIEVYKRRPGTAIDDLILTNDTWGENGDADQIRQTAASLSAFRLTEASEDAAFVVTLPPGVYTVNAKGAGDTTGVALVEVYLVP